MVAFPMVPGWIVGGFLVITDSTWRPLKMTQMVMSQIHLIMESTVCMFAISNQALAAGRDTTRNYVHDIGDTKIGRRKLWSQSLHGANPSGIANHAGLQTDTGARNGPLGLAMTC